jgi:hypothetical protein
MTTWLAAVISYADPDGDKIVFSGFPFVFRAQTDNGMLMMARLTYLSNATRRLLDARGHQLASTAGRRLGGTSRKRGASSLLVAHSTA